MTSDGILKKDWDRVTSLAAQIANETGEEGEKLPTRYVKKMFALLDSLEKKYGQMPSILATRADYIENTSKRLRLYERAYRIAKKLKDRKNLTFLSSSLCSLYVDEMKNFTKGRKWLKILRSDLSAYEDQDEAKTYRRLKRLMQWK